MRPKLILFVGAILAATISCNFDRVLDPSLPTVTPLATAPPPAPTPLPTPTYIPTPLPGARVESGDQAYWLGDWDQAIQEYTIALETSSDAETQSAALLGLGRSYYQAANYSQALNHLTTAITTHPDTPHRAAIFFALGETFTAMERPAEAAGAYQEYLSLRGGLIDAYLYEWIGDALGDAGNHQGAINNYLSALQSPSLEDGLSINTKIGAAYAAMGDHNTAIVTYEDVYARTNNDFLKADLRYRIGQSYYAIDRPDQSYVSFQIAVDEFPLSYSSYLSLVELVEADQEVDELSRGLVDYFAGQYGVAIQAFDRYLDDNPEHDDTAHYYKGLAYISINQYDTAIEEWEEMIEDHLNDRHWADAFDEIAFTQWFYMSDSPAAIDTYLDFVTRAGLHPQAPEFLYFAARVAERDFDLIRAANLWQRVGIEFSTSSWAYDGFFQSAITRYRLREFEAAREDFQSALGIAADSGEVAAAYFWMGKSNSAMGKNDEAWGAWQQAITSDPTGYYSERAADISASLDPFTPPASYSLSVDLAAERLIAEEWLKAAFAIPSDTDLRGPGGLLADPRLVRGTELWNLGLFNTARLEFESLRRDVAPNPELTYRLANYFREIGLYRSSILASRQILTLAGMDDAATMNAPAYFNYLRFGTYFEELVIPAADAYGFHPLFLYSVLRQESLFEGFVTSSAGARGLMQIIPDTGQYIYDIAGWPTNYTSADLYRPNVSITYGADYLSDQRSYFDNNLYVALAAYNGGPGNADNWLALAPDDPDLFLEVVRFSETRRYLRSIYEIYTIYRNLYRVE